MNNKYLIITGLILIAIFLGFGFQLYGVQKTQNSQTRQLSGLVPVGVPFQDVATSGRIAIGPVNTAENPAPSLLSTTSKRVYASLVKDCAADVWLFFNEDESVSTTSVQNAGGAILGAAGSAYEITQENLYTGSIKASTTASCNIFVTEGTN